MTRPQSTEAASYYFNYIDLITSDEIVPAMESQMDETLRFLEGISEEQSLTSYAPGKWTIRELLNHVNDTERVFLFRAFWFARGYVDELPSFDQEVAAAMSNADQYSWASHVQDFQAVRASTLTFFRSLPDDAWSRSGIASGNRVTVRALAYIIAGHVAHHLAVLQDKYLTNVA